MLLKFERLTALQQPAKSSETFVTDISGYHSPVPVDCHSLQYDAVQSAVNVPM